MLFTNDPRTEINRIFMNPDYLCPDQRRPLLYLLRRDLQNQYGKESAPPQKLVSPLLTSLGIMVGIELLTKYWSGDHDAGTLLIEKFLEKVASLSNQKAIALAQFRHALAHGYRLKTIRNKDQQVYTFALDDRPIATECIDDKGKFHYIINIWKLKELFLDVIEKYKKMLEASSDLQGKFMVVQKQIGEVEISS